MRVFIINRVLAAVFWLQLTVAVAPGRASDISPQDMVRDTSSRMLAALQAEQELIEKDASRLYQLVEQIVLPYFDFRRMSQWVLGKNWRQATAAQRDQFVEQFRLLLVRSYGTALLEYAGEEIVYLPFAAPSDAKKVTVRTEINQAGVGVIPVAYSMYQTAGGWKVYDISISGVSLVTSYRSTYGSIIRKHGIDSLIVQMTDHNRQRLDG
jgi:phospholipid transport system substrate-binding protein